MHDILEGEREAERSSEYWMMWWREGGVTGRWRTTMLRIEKKKTNQSKLTVNLKILWRRKKMQEDKFRYYHQGQDACFNYCLCQEGNQTEFKWEWNMEESRSAAGNRRGIAEWLERPYGKLKVPSSIPGPSMLVHCYCLVISLRRGRLRDTYALWFKNIFLQILKTSPSCQKQRKDFR